MSNTRKAIRQEVARLLAGTQVLTHITSADGASGGTTFYDYAYKSSLLQDGHFVGYPVYIASGMWVGLCRRVQAYDAFAGMFTVDDGFQFAADGTGVTTDASAKTLTDARQNWTEDIYVGATVTCNSQTLTVTSNTATVLTGTGGWSSDPGDDEAYAITYPVKSGVEYELHLTIHPTLINEAIDRALRKMLYKMLAVVSAFNDADMEDSTNGWTAGTGTTLARTTAAGEFYRGTQANKVTADATGDRYAYQRGKAVPGAVGFVYAVCRNDEATTSCKLIVYDVTNGAEIDSETSTQLAWQGLGFEFTVPSGCEEIEVRHQTITASKYSMWDVCPILWRGQRRFALPSWVTEEWQVGKTVYRPQGAERVSDATMVDRTASTRWPLILPFKEQATVYIAPDPAFNNNAPIYIECLRHYSALASDSATSDADLDWVAAKAKYECLRMLAAPLVPHEEREPFRQSLQEAKAEAAQMDARFMPQIEHAWGFGGERLFNVREV